MLRRFASAGGALAAGTEVRPPAANHRPLDDGSTAVAGLAVAAEHLDVHVLLAGFAHAIDVIAEAGTTVGDAAFDDGPAGGMEPRDRRRREDARGRIRADARLVERLVHVDVAEAGDASLVQQHRLHRRGAARESLPEVRRRERLVDGLRAEAGREKRGYIADKRPGAELPQVAPAEVVPTIQQETGALEWFGRRQRRPPHHATGHPQMGDERGAIIQLKQEVLSATAKLLDAAPDEVGLEDVQRDTDEAGQGGRVGIDPDDHTASHQRGKVAADGFDFGELWHPLRVRIRRPDCDPTRPYYEQVISQLRGELVHLDPGDLIAEVDVAGVVYEVHIPAFLWPELQSLTTAPEDGAESVAPTVALHIFSHATEKAPTPVLFGFLRRPERTFFRKFTTVEGIGPTKAVKAMNVSVSTIARAIEQEDRAALTRLPGIGARGADKIIATLRGKVTAEAALQDAEVEQPVNLDDLRHDRMALDAAEAIAGLGYARSEARRWVEEALADDESLATMEDLTLAVLRRRGGQS